MQTNPQEMSTGHTGQRDPAEDLGRGPWCNRLSRSHVTIIALGCSSAPDDQLIWLQSAVARFAALLLGIRMPSIRLLRVKRPASYLHQKF